MPWHFIIWEQLFTEKTESPKPYPIIRRPLQLNPDIIGASYNLGTIFQGKKQLDEAIMYYRKALDLDPGLVDPYYNIGLALQEQGRQAEAFAAYDKALQYNPSFLPARWAKCVAQLPVIYPDSATVSSSRTH